MQQQPGRCADVHRYTLFIEASHRAR